MTEYKILLSEQAVADMEDIYTYIATSIGMPQTAQNQVIRIADAIDSLRTMPHRIRIMRDTYGKDNELRRLLVDNYSVIFTVNDNAVHVVSVLYSASDISARLQDNTNR